MAVLTRNMEEASTRLEHLGGAMATLDQRLERVGSDVGELSQLKVHLNGWLRQQCVHEAWWHEAW